MNKKNKKFSTRSIHKGQKPEKLYGSVSLPMYLTSTFKQEEFGEYIYDSKHRKKLGIRYATIIILVFGNYKSFSFYLVLKISQIDP